MSREFRSKGDSQRFRFTPAVLGFLGGIFLLLFSGTTGDLGVAFWVIPCAVLLLLGISFLGRRFIPRFASWFQAGVVVSLSSIVGVLLLVGIFTAILFANFDTEYAPGYSEKAFKSIQLGATQQSVLSLLGEPIASANSEPFVVYIYSAEKQPDFSEDGIGSGTYTTMTFDKSRRLKTVFGQQATSRNSIVIGEGQNYLKLREQDIEELKGSTMEEIKAKFGSPAAVYEYKAFKVLAYSRSPSSANYHLRSLGLDENGMVVHIWRSIYWD